MTVHEQQSHGVRVRVSPGLCEGWGNCHRWAPDIYPVDETGHIDVHVVHVPHDRISDAVEGAMACPAHAIMVIRPDP